MAVTGAGFQPEALLLKLSRLNATQQSIETVSNYCTFFRKVLSPTERPLSATASWLQFAVDLPDLTSAFSGFPLFTATGTTSLDSDFVHVFFSWTVAVRTTCAHRALTK